MYNKTSIDRNDFSSANQNTSNSFLLDISNKHTKKKSNVNERWLKDNNETRIEIRKMIQTVQNSTSMYSEESSNNVNNQKGQVNTYHLQKQIPNPKYDVKKDATTSTHDHVFAQEKNVSTTLPIPNESHFIKNNQNQNENNESDWKDFSNQTNNSQIEQCNNQGETSIMLKKLELNTNEVLHSKILSLHEKGDIALNKIYQIKIRIRQTMELVKCYHDEILAKELDLQTKLVNTENSLRKEA